jgi:diguanylate cyclase (GGDEF)-like protein
MADPGRLSRTVPGNRLARLVASPAVRVWGWVVLLALMAVVVGFLTLQHEREFAAPFDVPWPLMAVAFFLGEANVVQVHFRRERHSFSLSELPGVIGLFLLSPTAYLLALLTGAGVALFRGGSTSMLKRSFNMANFALTAVVSLALFHAIAPLTGHPSPQDWVAAFATTTATSVIGAVAVATAISLSGGAPQYQKLPEMLQFSLMVALANTSLALLAVTVLSTDPLAIVLLVVPIAIVIVAYRAYVAEREKHERLELLYESSRILQHSPELDSAIAALLEHSRDMFRAERAEILLFPDATSADALRTVTAVDGRNETMSPVTVPLDDRLRTTIAERQGAFVARPSEAWTRDSQRVREAMVAPLVGERGVLGAMTVVDRMGEGSTFDADDVRLLETIANQAAVALENGQLEQSLTELSRLKEQLRHQAYHDSLTGLANRALFVEEVERRLEAIEDDVDLPVVLFLDLDDFKVVNDTLGHPVGDQLLVAVAERIRHEIRTEDLAARLGGDEFAVLPAPGTDIAQAVGLGGRVIDALKTPFLIGGTEVVVGASAGVAAARPGDRRGDELLRNADVAMYTAKADGKQRYSVFDPTVHHAIVERHTLSAELARNVLHEALEVHYQPIIELATGRPVGVEALARWRHPTRGSIDPKEFIRLAEESGAIRDLGRSVLRRSGAQVAAWQQLAGLEELTLSVNLSPLELGHAGFIEQLDEDMAAIGLRPESLFLELTETALARDPQATSARLHDLRDRGVRIAMDDFGTGYSSLAYLRRFPVDTLKIARELIGLAERDVQDPTEDWAFARAIVALGRTLGLKIVAEGIETPGQHAMLRHLGCDAGQGYLFLRPGPAAGVGAWLVEAVAAPNGVGTVELAAS